MRLQLQLQWRACWANALRKRSMTPHNDARAQEQPVDALPHRRLCDVFGRRAETSDVNVGGYDKRSRRRRGRGGGTRSVEPLH